MDLPALQHNGEKTLTTKLFDSKHYLSSSMIILASLLAGCASNQATDTPDPAYAPAPDNGQDTAAMSTGLAEPQRVVELRSDAPDTYVVRKGDTLWDISATFLKKPWYWPEIWNVNPQVKNPHLIYPGDVLSIYYVDGRPMLGINRGDHRLSPGIRVESLEDTARQFPIQSLRHFLLRSNVVSEAELLEAAHVVGSQDRRLVYGVDDEVCVFLRYTGTTDDAYLQSGTLDQPRRVVSRGIAEYRAATGLPGRLCGIAARQ